jgi:hypothetical protein
VKEAVISFRLSLSVYSSGIGLVSSRQFWMSNKSISMSMSSASLVESLALMFALKLKFGLIYAYKTLAT